MIITVTAPKKGLGQTTTTINVAAGLLKLTNELKMDSKILIIDINKYCKDIEYYLSNTVVSRGLDDFFSLYQSELLTEDSFKTCIKKINDNISIIGSNEYFEITEEAIEVLLKMTDRMYDFIIIDSIGSANINGIQKVIFDKSDKIIVTLNQTKSVTQIIRNRNIYRDEMNKTCYVINRNMDVTDTGVMNYGCEVIREELDSLGISSPLYPLNFDVEIMNEGNYGSILSFVLGDKTNKNEYNKQLRTLLIDLLKDNTKYEGVNTLDSDEKKSLFGLNFKW
ncbi:MAG: AAA family ATPase [Clostridia bacterium]|nr:AAA family ATPase [Clostridia bacterium]